MLAAKRRREGHADDNGQETVEDSPLNKKALYHRLPENVKKMPDAFKACHLQLPIPSKPSMLHHNVIVSQCCRCTLVSGA